MSSISFDLSGKTDPQIVAALGVVKEIASPYASPSLWLALQPGISFLNTAMGSDLEG